MGALDTQVVENRSNILVGEGLRVLGRILGNIGRRVAPRVVDNTAISASEKSHLRFPASRVARKFMHEHDRLAASRVFIVELYAIFRLHVAHVYSPIPTSTNSTLPQCTPWTSTRAWLPSSATG